ncbi:MAG TPA: HEAT repeat domain-containing protein [Actinobacteria bacterium]|nr:HEAT repeat domain-containing protein [Actinomycetota bacterium]
MRRGHDGSTSDKSHTIPSVCIFDGLSEVPREMIPPLIDALDQFALKYPRTIVATADLPIQRPEFSDRWALAVVGRVIGSGLGQSPTRSLLRILSEQESPDTSATMTSAQLIDKVLRERFNLLPESLDELGELAAASLSEDGRTILPVSQAVALHPSATKSALEVGLLRARQGYIHFNWRLAQDYLAARRLARDRRRWSQLSFSRLTHRGSHFEPLAIMRELLATKGQRDQLLRRVFDWNYRAAAYATRRQGRESGSAASRELEAVLIAMLAQRVHDEFESTAESALSTLKATSHPLAQRLQRAANMKEQQDALDDYVGPSPSEWYSRWQQVVTGSPAVAHDDLVAELENRDSILAWSASNVLSRSKVPPQACGALITLANQGSSPTTRWRAVHALGRTPRPAAIEALRERLLEDPDKWVQRGAIRSLLEIGLVGTASIRRTLVETLQDDRTKMVIAEKRDLLVELIRASVPSDEDEDPQWLEQLAAVLGSFWAAERDPYRRETLERTAGTLSRLSEKAAETEAP